jgi:hypothetical protein
MSATLSGLGGGCFLGEGGAEWTLRTPEVATNGKNMIRTSSCDAFMN